MNKRNMLLAGLMMVGFAIEGTAAVVDVADDFDTNTGTYPVWASVGGTATTIEYDNVSVEDYDDGNISAKLAYSDGMQITGDSIKNDGGLRFNTQNASPGDEVVGLTVGGTLELGEELTFTGSVYNDNSSFSRYKAQLWNLTGNSLLAETGVAQADGSGHAAYVPIDFNLAYTAVSNDVGATLQLRLVEHNDNAARDIYVDNFTFHSSLSGTPPTPTYSTPSTNKFWFSFYSTIGDDSADAVENGATGIGPYYGGTSGQVSPLAEAATLSVNFSYKVNLPSMDGYKANNDFYDSWAWPSDAQLIAEATAAVDAVKTNQNIIMWDLVPEELRYWKVNELNLLHVVSDAIRAADPMGRPVMMYEPNHRASAALAQTLPYQDICGKGMYISTTSEFRHNRIWARWSMEQELGAIAAANTNASPWILLWMAADAQEGEEHLIGDWCRHDAYMGLIMGGKGISIWSGYRPRAGFSNDFQAYFDGYLSVAADLNQERNLAPVFLYGTEVAGVTHNVTAGPPELELDYPAGTINTYPPVTYTMREFLGQQYLFMVNSATQAVSLTFSGVPDAARTDLFNGTNYAASGGSFGISLAAYEVAAFRFDGYAVWLDANFTAQQVLDGDADESADPDSDGKTNREEFNAGTDPNNESDVATASLSFSNSWSIVNFNTVDERYYNVDWSTNLVTGTWVSMLENELGTATNMKVIDPNQYPKAFYRAEATRP